MPRPFMRYPGEQTRLLHRALSRLLDSVEPTILEEVDPENVVADFHHWLGHTASRHGLTSESDADHEGRERSGLRVTLKGKRVVVSMPRVEG